MPKREVNDSSATESEANGLPWLLRFCFGLLCFDLLLTAAYLLWHDVGFGQSDRAYFDFAERVTLPSWTGSMTLFAAALLALTAFHKHRRAARPAWSWLGLAGVALVLSLAEMTRVHQRLDLFLLASPNAFEQLLVIPCWLAALGLLALKLLSSSQRAALLWALPCLLSWLALPLLQLAAWHTSWFAPQGETWQALYGTAYLLGATSLLACTACGALGPMPAAMTCATGPLVTGRRRWLLYLGVGGTTCTIIFLQIVLFQMLIIFGDHLTANSIISVALLGIAAGGAIGWWTSHRCPWQALITASLLLPLAILAAFGTAVELLDQPLLASLLLTMPFIAATVVISVVLNRGASHRVYCIDLLGASVGALLVDSALVHFREEGTLFVLAGFTCLLGLCFVLAMPRRQWRLVLISLAVVAAGLSFGLGHHILETEKLNLIQHKLQRQYPQMELLFSRSSFVGRYDIVRRSPNSSVVKAYNNGRTIDTIRTAQPPAYEIDPRLPSGLIENPAVLIIGVSGDGITKTSRLISNDITGLEINPAIARLQADELRPYNGNSYDGIDIRIIDGRSYLEQTDKRYDFITLLNAHTARGGTKGRAASPEYLTTHEAVTAYLEHLTDRGMVNIEEPCGEPDREPAIWKILWSMRAALVDFGAADPASHFFIFQWRTRSNNYYQILMKRTPFTATELAKLRAWLDRCDRRKEIESARQEGRLGPITTRTTEIHAPDRVMTTTAARLLRGEMPAAFMAAHNLYATTDSRPFLFDLDPARSEIKEAYTRTLLMLLLLLPVFAVFLFGHRAALRQALPYVFLVAYTGIGYFMVEIVLIERFEIFLGSPVVTFSTVLGSLLVASGAGSWWSGHLTRRGIQVTMAAIVVFLLLQQLAVPHLFPWLAGLPLALKIVISVLTIAPLGFFLGVPFPYVMRGSQTKLSDSAAAMLFAINGAASAVAVPLAINMSTVHGTTGTFNAGIIVYVIVGLLLIALRQSRFLLVMNALATIGLGLFLAWPWVMGAKELRLTSAGTYRVLAATYGYSAFKASRIYHDSNSEDRVAFAWMFWVILGDDGRVILVDTGSEDADEIKRFGIQNYVPPRLILEELGIAPAAVTDVILTHAHWDHIGTVGDYPNARIWIQKQEYEFAREAVSATRPRARGLDWRQVQVLLTAESAGRLQVVDGPGSPAPGIELIKGGSHTPGMQYVTVETLNGRIVLAADTTYLYSNNRWHRPTGATADVPGDLATIKQMQDLAISPFYVVPGHDPRVAHWFPAVSDHVVELTPRMLAPVAEEEEQDDEQD